MLRQCNRLFPFILLLLCCMGAHANTSLNEDELDFAERAWLSSNKELIIGMPMMGDPPYSYKDAEQRFSGPRNGAADRQKAWFDPVYRTYWIDHWRVWLGNKWDRQG